MPQFLTFSDLKRLTPTLAESRELRKVAASKVGKTVFLSHSSKDNAYLPPVIQILESHGGKVYVDNGDSRLPATPSPKTAQILRDTLKQCRRLVLFVTTNSKDSRWMPWELGLGDGCHNPYSVALFPVAAGSYEQQWSEREYLGLYQRIVWGRIGSGTKSHWIVWDHHRNTALSLREWLRGY